MVNSELKTEEGWEEDSDVQVIGVRRLRTRKAKPVYYAQEPEDIGDEDDTLERKASDLGQGQQPADRGSRDSRVKSQRLSGTSSSASGSRSGRLVRSNSNVTSKRSKLRRGGADEDSDYDDQAASVASDAEFEGPTTLTVSEDDEDFTGRSESSSRKRKLLDSRKSGTSLKAKGQKNGKLSNRGMSKALLPRRPSSSTSSNTGTENAKTNPDTMKNWRPHGQAYHTVDQLLHRVEALLDWFDVVRTKRKMPWRKVYDPNASMKEKGQRAYEIWVSEVMLQQTQVSTVIPYWTRWLERWPTIADLAKADIEEVNSAWKGLGYYRRARSLLMGAQAIIKDPKYDGRLPEDPAQLEKDVPGIGRYTAGAICSIAYGVKTPIVDGNIHRLLCRVLALHAPPTSPTLIKTLWDRATQLVDNLDTTSRPGAAGDWNQALMELGSQVCKPTNPDCSSCPLQPSCKAFKELSNPPPPTQEGDDNCAICVPPVDLEASELGSVIPSVTIFPMKKIAKASREEATVVCVVKWKPEGSDQKPEWLFTKRPETGLLAGLFEPPSVPIEHEGTKQDILRSCSQLLSDELGLETVPTIMSKGSFIHIFSHIRMTYHVVTCVITSERRPELKSERGPDSVLWATSSSLPEVNIGTGVKKVWDLAYGKGSWPNPKAKNGQQRLQWD